MLCISNIAWPNDAEQEAIDLVSELKFRGVELAPTKVFGPWDHISFNFVADYRARLADRNLKIPAFQGILYGTTGLSLFEGAEAQSRLRQHLEQVARVAGVAGARALVFGAPGARNPGELSAEAAFDVAVRFFADIAGVFESEGTCLAFEANTADWGCRFVTTTPEAARLVEAIDRPGIRLQLDTGAAFVNQEPLQAWAGHVPWACHLHVSEPRLLPVGNASSDHATAGAAIRKQNYQGWRSIEMRSVDDWRERLVIAADILQQNY